MRYANMLWGNVRTRNGLSAYQIAVLNGFIGTEVQWLASLVGAAGADGADGAPGADGLPGADGEDGAAGANGATGRGIVSVLLTNTVGLVKTYTITFTDETTTTFDVADGADGEGGGSGIPELHLDFEESGDIFIYNVPYNMKFTSMVCEGTNPTLSVALNTILSRYSKLTITATATGLVSIYGEYL